MNRKRLRKLADFLMELPDERFDIGVIQQSDFQPEDCRTVACAMGWAPHVFPRSGLTYDYYREEFVYKNFSCSQAIEEFFGINDITKRKLFYPTFYQSGYCTRPCEVASKIYRLLDGQKI